MSSDAFDVSRLFSSDCLFWLFFIGGTNVPTQIDSGISQAVSDTNKISMTKNMFGDGRIETAVTAEIF